MKTIALLPWDGIWPEVIDAAVQIIDAVAPWKFSYSTAFVGWAAYEHHGIHLPQETIDTCEKSDAMLLWAIWWPVDQQHLPKRKDAEKNALLGLRKHFDLGINVRPVQMHPALSDLSPLKPSIIWKWIDFVVIRELVGGIYFGEHTMGEWWATDVMKYTTKQIIRPLHFAAQTAQKRSGKVIVVDKANVLESSRLRRATVEDIKIEYPDIEREFMYVDNAAMQLIRNPWQFDVVVTGNMFGDILTDAASVLPGSLGLMPSASVWTTVSMYEPIHGSAPDIAWQWIANPIATILSAAMMLRYSFDMHEEADCIENAVHKTLSQWYKTWDLWKSSDPKFVVNTTWMTQAIISNL